MKNITQAIIEVMKDINGVAKSMTVGEGKNAYKGVSDKDVKELIRESMIKNGLAIIATGITPKIQIDRWEEDDTYNKNPPYPKKSKQSVFTEVVTKYILLHTSGESIEISGYGQGVDTQDKGAGKATTYALKNALLNTFLVPTGVDTDNTHSDDYDVPKSKNKALTLDDYITLIKENNNIDHIRVLYKQAVSELFLNPKDNILIGICEKQVDRLQNPGKYNTLPNNI